MNPLTLFLTCGILLTGNGLPYGNLFSKYENRDDYYEDYYLRKLPKLKTTPDKVRELLINHLSWFPVDELKKERKREHRSSHDKRSYFVNLQLEEDTTATSTRYDNITRIMREKFMKLKNYTEFHHIPTNWSSIKEKSSNSIHKVKQFVHKKHMSEVFKNVTHPLRYRGPLKHHSNHSKHDNYKYFGPSVRIHPKSSHVEVIKTSSTTYSPFPDMHFSIPRKIKVVIDLETPDKPTKIERKVNDKYLVGIDGTNSSNVLETAGEMASDLAGRMTSLWHCVLGSHRIPDTKDVKFYLYTRQIEAKKLPVWVNVWKSLEKRAANMGQPLHTLIIFLRRNIIQPELLRVNYDLIKEKVKTKRQNVDVDCVDLSPENIPEFERVSDENREIIKSNFLNIRAPTKILIHGYTGSYKDSRMAKIKDAYLTNGRYNVIQVDWEMLAAPPCYIRVTHHSKFVGETIAKFLDGLYLVGLNMSLVHLVGFSLGAQVAGFTGNNATIVPVCRITGLDPALPLFLHTEPSGHLDKLDAKFVDVIHTCGGILAMLDPLGHVDFYPNGGTRQPGCEFSNLKCSHSRAPQYFAESVVSQKKFTGQLCLNWEEYVAGNCDNSTNTSFMGEPCSRRSVYGKYYLLTKSKEPFVL